MQTLYSLFEQRETIAIAIAQEDKDLKSHNGFVTRFEGDLPFKIVADLEGVTLPHFDRTTTYFIDSEGIVREIFPALIHMRPSWHAVLNRMDQFENGL